MDPVARRMLWEVLSAVRDSGRTLVLTSHRSVLCVSVSMSVLCANVVCQCFCVSVLFNKNTIRQLIKAQEFK